MSGLAAAQLVLHADPGPQLRLPALFAVATLLGNVAAFAAIALRHRRQHPAGRAEAARTTAPSPAAETPGGRRTSRRAVDRVVGAVVAAVLLVVYLLAVVPTLAAVPLLFGLDTSVAVTPGGQLYTAAATVLSVSLTIVALRYGYYYYCWFTSRRFFRAVRPPDPAVLAARDLPYLKVQVTTKGGALPVVERSLRELQRICAEHEWLAPKLSVEVITERAEEVLALQAGFARSVLSVTALALPPDYQTPRGTLLKARALHYLVELRRAGLNRKPGRTFIVHFDEETYVTEEHLLVLVDYLSDHPAAVSQGPIVYPLEWSQTPLMCRALECMRPFGCSECARVMANPPPPHLHGSNLVVEEAAENEIGWDLGTMQGQPYVAEDLLFGLRAYSMLGPQGFGWHGATMLEQPPLTLYWAVQQRLRWVLGAMQGLWAMRHDAGYDGISGWHKRRLTAAIASRIATYCLGYPLGFAGLYFFLRPVHAQLHWSSPLAYYRVLIIAAGVGWLLSYQIGLARNLRYQNTRWTSRIGQHISLLLVTPLAGLCETVGPYVAVMRWLMGARKARWTPTPKLADGAGRPLPAAEPSVVEAPEPARV